MEAVCLKVIFGLGLLRSSQRSVGVITVSSKYSIRRVQLDHRLQFSKRSPFRFHSFGKCWLFNKLTSSTFLQVLHNILNKYVTTKRFDFVCWRVLHTLIYIFHQLLCIMDTSRKSYSMLPNLILKYSHKIFFYWLLVSRIWKKI